MRLDATANIALGEVPRFAGGPSRGDSAQRGNSEFYPRYKDRDEVYQATGRKGSKASGKMRAMAGPSGGSL